MTKEQKFQTIVDRFKLENLPFDITPIHLSTMVILDYMDVLFNNGLIYEKPLEITEMGKKALALCQEFDWKPTNTEIVNFCKEMIDKTQVDIFIIELKSLRDDRETFLKNAKKHINY